MNDTPKATQVDLLNEAMLTDRELRRQVSELLQIKVAVEKRIIRLRSLSQRDELFMSVLGRYTHTLQAIDDAIHNISKTVKIHRPIFEEYAARELAEDISGATENSEENELRDESKDDSHGN